MPLISWRSLLLVVVALPSVCASSMHKSSPGAVTSSPRAVCCVMLGLCMCDSENFQGGPLLPPLHKHKVARLPRPGKTKWNRPVGCRPCLHQQQPLPIFLFFKQHAVPLAVSDLGSPMVWSQIFDDAQRKSWQCCAAQMPNPPALADRSELLGAFAAPCEPLTSLLNSTPTRPRTPHDARGVRPATLTKKP